MSHVVLLPILRYILLHIGNGELGVAVIQRGKSWHLKRRVPKRYQSVEPKEVIWKSLKTDSRSTAESKAVQIWSEYISAWEAKLANHSGDAEAHFRAAHDLAGMRGFPFQTATSLADGPLEQILERVEASRDSQGQIDVEIGAALLGAVEEPNLMLSDLVERVEKLTEHDNRFKNPEQMRLWRNPRKRAVKNLMDAIGGDRPVVQVSSIEARSHKKFWVNKILEKGLSNSTANKDFTYLSGMLTRFYDDLDYEDPPRPYGGVTIRDRHAEPRRKLEVPIDWILEKWFAPGAFDKLNAEARDILLISIETGCRQREIFELPSSAFKLNGNPPHLCIQNEAAVDPADRREIKNTVSRREVPLAGVALAAARRHPNGFPRYRGKSGYSNLVNKYLRAHNLVPAGVTAGSIRHTWESRLKEVGLQTDDRGELMGHSVKARRGREVYGNQMTLKERLEAIKQIILPVPDHLI